MGFNNVEQERVQDTHAFPVQNTQLLGCDGFAALAETFEV